MTNVRTWNQLMRVEQQDPDLAEPQPDVVDLNPPVSHTYDAQQAVQVRPGGTGAQHQVTTSVSDSYNANSTFFHGNINPSSDGGEQVQAVSKRKTS